MKRKIIIFWLCVLAALLPLAAGLAAESSPDSDVWIMYVPGANEGGTEQNTAKYAAKVLRARWPEKGSRYHWYRTVASKETSEKDVLADKNYFQASSSVGSDGSGPFQLYENNKNKNAVDKIIPYSQAHDLWLIVPSSAADNVAANYDWMNYFRDLLDGNQGTALHLLFIGKGPAGLAGAAAADAGAEQGGSALQVLAGEYPDRVGWMVIRDNFTQTDTGDRNTHTGDFFIASLYGAEPADLEIGEGNTVTVPGSRSGSVLVISRDFNSAGITVKDEYNNVTSPVLTAEASEKQGMPLAYSGVFFRASGGLLYTVQAENPESESLVLRAYWYPDMAETVAPAFELAGEQLGFGENEISIRVADDLDRPESFTPEFIIYRNGDENDRIPVSPRDIAWNQAEKKWTYTLSVASGTDSVTVIPSLTMDTRNGNMAWKWNGEPQTLRSYSEGVQKKENPPAEADAYVFDNDTAGVRISAHDIFIFNKDDPNVSIGVIPPDEKYGITAQYEPETQEFAIDITDPARFSKHHGESVPVQFTGGENLSHTLDVKFLDAKELLKSWIDIDIRYPEGKEVKAGSVIPVTVSISGENRDAYDRVCGKIETVPAADQLTVGLFLNGEPAGEANLTAAGVPCETEAGIPAEAENGSARELEVIVGSGNYKIDRASVSLTVINTPPYKNNSLKEKETVRTGDFPVIQEHQPADLLKELGLEEPFSLFSDEEGYIRAVTLEIEGTDGLKTEEIPAEAAEEPAPGGETPEAPEAGETDENAEEKAETPAMQTEGNRWVFTLTADHPRVPVRILTAKAGELKITLTADDGANDPVSQKISVKVESRWIGIILIAGAALGALLLALAAFLIIRQVRKPKFDNIRIRCLLWSEESQERAKEVLSKSKPVSMARCGKKPATLTTALILTRQTPLPPDQADIAEDILLMPTKHDELSIVFGSKAMAATGRQEKKELLAQGNSYRLRVGSQYLLIENVQ